MPTSYNQITGQSLERLAALSDGIFAVAMTLLVLDLHVPASEVIHSQGELWHTLSGAAPQLISYIMSFLTLGIFWNGQQAQLNSFSRSDRHFSWIRIAFLFAVSIMPFSTRLLAEFITYRSVLIAYWANILLLGVVLFGSWRYARRAGLLREEITHIHLHNHEPVPVEWRQGSEYDRVVADEQKSARQGKARVIKQVRAAHAEDRKQAEK
jgi:uncharacterized membrane protein